MPTSDTTKIFKASENAKSGLELSETSAALIGDKKSAVIADENGVFIKGKISIIAPKEQIRTGGLFVGLPDLLSMVPSTLISPIPQQIPMPPMHGLTNLQLDVAFFLSLLI
jgi:hypothetical protein